MIKTIACVTVFEKLDGPISDTAGGEIRKGFATFTFLHAVESTGRLDPSGEKIGSQCRSSIAFLIIAEDQALKTISFTHGGCSLGTTHVYYLSSIDRKSRIHTHWKFDNSFIALNIPIDSNVLGIIDIAYIYSLLIGSDAQTSLAAINGYINGLIVQASVRTVSQGGSSGNTTRDKLVSTVSTRYYVLFVHYLKMSITHYPISAKGQAMGQSVCEFDSVVLR